MAACGWPDRLRLLRAVLCVQLAAVLCTSAAAQSPDTSLPVIKRGLIGELRFRHTGPELRADPDQDLSSPILLRIESSATDRGSEVVVRFMGTVAGTYNLSEWMVGPDGLPIEGLDPHTIKVVSDLPPGQGSNLYEIADPAISIRGGYRKLLWILILLWCLVPVLLLLRRWLRHAAVAEPVPAAPPPTLADQLRPLALRAREQALTVEERSRLELLLYFFWRERLGRLSTPMNEVLPLLREHPEAAPLLSAVEDWLHRPGGGTDRADDAALDGLLEPYRQTPAVSEEDLAVLVRGGNAS